LGAIQHISCVGDLNKIIVEGGSRKCLSLAESLQTKKLVELANAIAEKKSTIKLILIAGPSSVFIHLIVEILHFSFFFSFLQSGKTTFAAKLSLQLEIFGFQPLVLSVDNYCMTFIQI